MSQRHSCLGKGEWNLKSVAIHTEESHLSQGQSEAIE